MGKANKRRDATPMRDFLDKLPRMWEGRRSRAIAFGLLAFISIAGVFVLWQYFGPAILNDPSQFVSTETIEVSDQPAWIPCNVKAEVFRDDGVRGEVC